MKLNEVAFMANTNTATLQSWIVRGHIRFLDEEVDKGTGFHRQFGPRTSAAMIAVSILVHIGFTVEAASAFVYTAADRDRESEAA